MTNPNPGRITDAMWWLWTTVAAFIPGVRLGGIYAFKSGYHSTVLDNQANWPKNYSIRLPLDLSDPEDMARAIDFTMSTAEMILRTGYLKRSALHPDDNRLYAVREFYGTLDGVTVYGLIQDGDGVWRESTSDLSHTWHNHDSIFTAYCDDLDAMQALASVLAGETWEQWNNGATPEDDMLTVIQTKDVAGETVLMYPWAGTWRRVPAEALDNALGALSLSGVKVDSTTWPGPYDFDDEFIQASWGVEVKAAGGETPVVITEAQIREAVRAELDKTKLAPGAPGA